MNKIVPEIKQAVKPKTLEELAEERKMKIAHETNIVNDTIKNSDEIKKRNNVENAMNGKII